MLLSFDHVECDWIVKGNIALVYVMKFIDKSNNLDSERSLNFELKTFDGCVFLWGVLLKNTQLFKC